MRTVAVFTATRAEYGLLRPLLLRLRESRQCRLQLIVSGTHLSHAHGYTLTEIQHDGFEPDATIPLDFSKDSPGHLCGALGTMIAETGASLARLQPDIFVLLGDRYECLGAATAAAMMQIPVAHIHGGEITRGALDDSFRHAVTKLSHLHFTSCEPYRQRVIQLGEQPDRVWNVGALGVENALSLPLFDETAVRDYLHLEAGRPYFLCTFHPVTLEPGQEETQWREMQQALERYANHAVVVTGANADPGGGLINRMLAQWGRQQPERVRLFDSLGVLRYLSAAKYAACVVGNSSSGIIEIPSLGVPVVNIGDRQQGRIASPAVLHCPPEEDAIIASLTQALTPGCREHARVTPNPYEKAETSAAIAEILLTFPLRSILKKVFFDIVRQ